VRRDIEALKSLCLGVRCLDLPYTYTLLRVSFDIESLSYGQGRPKTCIATTNGDRGVSSTAVCDATTRSTASRASVSASSGSSSTPAPPSGSASSPGSGKPQIDMRRSTPAVSLKQFREGITSHCDVCPLGYHLAHRGHGV
jgi:hypothetical protein